MEILTFKEVLNDFAHAVSEKKYLKLEYGKWRKLVVETVDKLISLELDGNTIFLMKVEGVPYETNYGTKIKKIRKDIDWFECDDKSFGQFLNDKYFSDKVINNKEIEKEKSNMDCVVSKNMFNFDFGVISNGEIRMSPFGMAMMNVEGQWVCYDAANDQVVNVDGLIFDIKGMLFKMPVALKDVAVGDMIRHQGHYVYVIDFPADGNGLVVVDVEQGENRVIRPTTNMFGFNFVTKVVSMFNMTGMCGAPSAEQPFGNIMPLLMMNQFMGNGENLFGDNGDMSQLMMMSMFMGGTNPFANMFAAAPTHECHCKGEGCQASTNPAN